jgi:unsaturated rhamnogalacturonyl hydrolase
MKRLLNVVIAVVCFTQVFAEIPWSQRMANSVMLSNPTKYGTYWDYVNGTVLSGFQALYTQTANSTYLTYIESTTKAHMAGFSTNTKTLDNIKEGTALLFMYENTTTPADKTAYQNKAVSVRSLLNESGGISRTTEGGLWHKDPGYAWQMWGDGLYMAQPFYAQYSVLFNSAASEDFDDIANQFSLFETHARNNVSGLLYHGWSEQPLDAASTAWADPITGLSDNFWGRALGWYIMGLVDVLDYFPTDHEKYADMIAILNRLAPALINVQDPISGCWYDVVNLPDSCSSTRCNYLESSATCMITYSLLKAIRLGYISDSYLPAAKKAYEGIINTFVTTDGNSVIIANNCQVSGLGGSKNRDGSFEYYMSEPVVTTNEEGKPIGPFILASLEYEALQPETKNIAVENDFFKVINRSENEIELCYVISKAQKIVIRIFDVTGKKVNELLLDKKQAGSYQEQLSLVNLHAGVYFIQLVTETGVYGEKFSLR